MLIDNFFPLNVSSEETIDREQTAEPTPTAAHVTGSANQRALRAPLPIYGDEDFLN